MPNLLLFEHPLNERTRTLLRISHLFEQFEYHLSGSSPWQSRAALQALLDITNILARADIKSELAKQLSQHGKALKRIATSPDVDQQRLDQVLEEIDFTRERLQGSSSQFGNALRKNEFLNSIVQRAPIPGGSFEFDLPQYHYWLNLPHTERVIQLEGWRQEISLVQDTVELLLGLLRSSTVPQKVVAQRGLFQKSLDSKRRIDLIQVSLAPELQLFAEISGSKHRFVVRFMETSQWERPAVTDDDVPFLLKSCAI